MKRGSIIREQYISLNIVSYTKINDKNSERPHVDSLHRYIKHIHCTNRCILKIKSIFSSMRYGGAIVLGTPVLTISQIRCERTNKIKLTGKPV